MHADWFCPNRADGLTQAGLIRINQSIEAFVYCVLGSQVNVRSSILGSGGREKEAHSEFLVLVEDVIKQSDLVASVQRYQLSIDEAKVRLNLAVATGAWLMPGRMLINTESAVGYNNQLKKAGAGMKLGINNEVNTSTKKGPFTTAGGKSKINPPNSHPSNPIHKATTTKKRKPMACSAALKRKETIEPSIAGRSEAVFCSFSPFPNALSVAFVDMPVCMSAVLCVCACVCAGVQRSMAYGNY